MTHLGVLFEDGLHGVEYLLHCLEELRLAGVAVVDAIEQRLDILALEGSLSLHIATTAHAQFETGVAVEASIEQRLNALALECSLSLHIATKAHEQCEADCACSFT